MKKLIFTFGRYQPITIAHYNLLLHVHNKGKQEKCNTVFGISRTQDAHTNILSWQEKFDIISSIVPSYNIVTDEKLLTPFQIVEFYIKEHFYQDIELIVGSDRTETLGATLEKYALEWGAKKFKVVEYDNRDTGAYANVSGTATRELAKQGKFEEFKKLLAPCINTVTAEKFYLRYKDATTRSFKKTSTRNTRKSKPDSI